MKATIVRPLLAEKEVRSAKTISKTTYYHLKTLEKDLWSLLTCRYFPFETFDLLNFACSCHSSFFSSTRYLIWSFYLESILCYTSDTLV